MLVEYLLLISGDQLPGNLHKELGQVYSSAGELLRHFWSCFPPRTPQLQEKLHKMHETLCRYHNATIRPFQVGVHVVLKQFQDGAKRNLLSCKIFDICEHSEENICA